MNKVILMGRLTNDPELRHTTSNVAVTNFRLAVNRRFQKDVADFIDVVAWRQTAEFVSNYFRKGMRAAVCGNIQSREWEDKDGKKRHVLEVIAEEIYFADSKKETVSQQDGMQVMTDMDVQTNDGDELPF